MSREVFDEESKGPFGCGVAGRNGGGGGLGSSGGKASRIGRSL